MTSKELRNKFLEFFEGKGHLRLPSFPLIPKNDPTLLLVGAGMVPLKPYFLGAEVPPRQRVTTCQKCIRTPDIENVGKTARHGTFFEMLGNFSFGDYFKEDVIQWAFEFLTKELNLPADRLYASVYLDDDEAYDIWRDKVGFPEDRIVRLGKEDNFWEVGGGPGPCGPCSEIIYDRGEKYGCGRPDCGVECDCDRFVEIWNLVFIQFNKDEEGRYNPLSQKCIDTGMGLERVAAILQDVDTIQDIDIVRPVIKYIEKLSGTKYGEAFDTDWAIRVITDHARSVTFMVGDGIIPSNEGRGYVLRRLLRRAIRFGRQIGLQRGSFPKVAKVVIDIMGDVYEGLNERSEYILKAIANEEDRFNDTLDEGMAILQNEIKGLKEKGAGELPGDVAFRLYDTFGFPLELTEEVSGEEGLELDKDGFKRLMDEQRERARSAREDTGYIGRESAQYIKTMAGISVDFVGYDKVSHNAGEILKLITGNDTVEALSEGESGEIVLDTTPFYGESGGQIGDTGTIITESGEAEVVNTGKPSSTVIVHHVKVINGSIKQGQKAKASVNPERRQSIARNHTATHLLQKALKQVLGEHISQAGSRVTDDRLRFDFSHLEQVTPEQLKRVEFIVNDAIMADLQVVTEYMSLEDAKGSGATALFDEKYGDTVRVVKVGDFSAELCGGTHVRRTGQIGSFKITSEGSVAAGVRRIEAITGFGTLALIDSLEAKLDKISSILKASQNDAIARAEQLMDDNQRLEKEIAGLKAEKASGEVGNILKSAKTVGDTSVIIYDADDLDGAQLRETADMIKSKLGSSVVLLASTAGDKLMFICTVTPDLVKKGIKAGDIVKEAAKAAGGGGGGRPDMAQAGAKDVAGLNDALETAEEYIMSAMNKMF